MSSSLSSLPRPGHLEDWKNTGRPVYNELGIACHEWVREATIGERLAALFNPWSWKETLWNGYKRDADGVARVLIPVDAHIVDQAAYDLDHTKGIKVEHRFGEGSDCRGTGYDPTDKASMRSFILANADDRLRSIGKHKIFLDTENSVFLFMPNGDVEDADAILVCKSPDDNEPLGCTRQELAVKASLWVEAYDRALQKEVDIRLYSEFIIDAGTKNLIGKFHSLNPAKRKTVYLDIEADGLFKTSEKLHRAGKTSKESPEGTPANPHGKKGKQRPEIDFGLINDAEFEVPADGSCLLHSFRAALADITGQDIRNAAVQQQIREGSADLRKALVAEMSRKLQAIATKPAKADGSRLLFQDEEVDEIAFVTHLVSSLEEEFAEELSQYQAVVARPEQLEKEIANKREAHKILLDGSPQKASIKDEIAAKQAQLEAAREKVDEAREKVEALEAAIDNLEFIKSQLQAEDDEIPSLTPACIDALLNYTTDGRPDKPFADFKPYFVRKAEAGAFLQGVEIYTLARMNNVAIRVWTKVENGEGEISYVTGEHQLFNEEAEECISLIYCSKSGKGNPNHYRYCPLENPNDAASERDLADLMDQNGLPMGGAGLGPFRSHRHRHHADSDDLDEESEHGSTEETRDAEDLRALLAALAAAHAAARSGHVPTPPPPGSDDRSRTTTSASDSSFDPWSAFPPGVSRTSDDDGRDDEARPAHSASPSVSATTSVAGSASASAASSSRSMVRTQRVAQQRIFVMHQSRGQAQFIFSSYQCHQMAYTHTIPREWLSAPTPHSAGLLTAPVSSSTSGSERSLLEELD